MFFSFALLLARPKQRPPVDGPTPQSYTALANDLARQRHAEQQPLPAATASGSHRGLQQTNQGICDIFDWGARHINLRTQEATVHDDVWGSTDDPYLPTVQHDDHAQEIRYCYKEMFAGQFSMEES